ncbi:MAG: hypothetical protein NZ534_07795, partial [Bacteroidia bacterium]|nr:hypothetical protein [Bacteroidia bacterium]
MYKIVLTALATISLCAELRAQCTANPNITSTGLYPNPAPDGTVNTPYNNGAALSMTVKFPRDSTFTLALDGLPPLIPLPSVLVTYTSFTITGTTNVPPGMTFSTSGCNNPGCVYPISPLEATNRGCIPLSGTPTQSGVYELGVQTEATGSFIMPDLSNPFLPGFDNAALGLPPAGTIVLLNDPNPVLNAATTPARQMTFSTSLTINPETFTPLCNESVPVVKGKLRPNPLPDGTENTPYNAVQLTLDLPTDSNFVFGSATFTQFQIDSLGGLPAGLTFDNQNCLNQPCIYELDAADPGANRICFRVNAGTPTENGVFYPFIRLKASGTVVVAGQSFDINSPLLPPQAQGARRLTFRTQLKITPASLTPPCNGELAVSSGSLRPVNLPEGNQNLPYSVQKLTLDLPTDSTVSIPFLFEGTATFTAFTIDSLGGLPSGLTFSNQNCLTQECRYVVNPLDPGKNRVCFNVNAGIPTESGTFTPFVIVRAEGFVTTSTGQVVDLPSQISTLTYRCTLNIQPSSPTPLCNETVAVASGQLRPNPMPDGQYATPYPQQSMTLDLPTSQNFDIPFVGTASVTYSRFTIDSLTGLPPGMNFVGDCVAGGCVLNLNALDPGANRFCFAIAGTPDGFVNDSVYRPRVHVTGDGIAQTPFGDFNLTDPQVAQTPGVRRRSFATELTIRGVPVVSRTENRTLETLSARPNPFARQTEIVFSLNDAAAPTLVVTDALGRIVYEKRSPTLPPGTH